MKMSLIMEIILAMTIPTRLYFFLQFTFQAIPNLSLARFLIPQAQLFQILQDKGMLVKDGILGLVRAIHTRVTVAISKGRLPASCPILKFQSRKLNTC